VHGKSRDAETVEAKQQADKKLALGKHQLNTDVFLEEVPIPATV
jgi:hypothetical protein